MTTNLPDRDTLARVIADAAHAHHTAMKAPHLAYLAEADAVLDHLRATVPTVSVEEACEVMHDAYERAAVGAGWETQAASRKPWADVPEPNKATMRAAVSALLDHLRATGHAATAGDETVRLRADLAALRARFREVYDNLSSALARAECWDADPPAPATDGLRERIEALHVRAVYRRYDEQDRISAVAECAHDHNPWPCQTIRALAATGQPGTADRPAQASDDL